MGPPGGHNAATASAAVSAQSRVCSQKDGREGMFQQEVALIVGESR
jgi:hypothetical protein